MKKKYFQPEIRLVSSTGATMIIATSGGASEIHEGDGTKDTETTPSMQGTGDSDDFTLHSHYRGFYE